MMALTLRLKALILPPAGPLIVACAGLLLHAGGMKSSGLLLTATGLSLLYLASAPWLGQRLLQTLDRGTLFDPESDGGRAAGAIVILDAGRRSAPPERGGDSVSLFTLERLTAGAEIYRRLEVPILVSGDGAHELMAEVLDHLFDVPVRWVERDSRNTQENAVCSARVLLAADIDHIVLVTHFWHMPRAAAAFRRAGLGVVPAPTGFAAKLRAESGLMALVPSARALSSTYLALHEWLGIAWYRIRYRQQDAKKNSTAVIT